MSTIGDKRTAALTAARQSQADLQALLVASGLSDDLTATIVPVGFAVTVSENPGSSNTTEQNRTLATNNGLELYEP